MSQQYASSQSVSGYKNHIEKVAIIGAGGNLGKYIVDALLQTGKHTVTAITRADSKSIASAGASVIKVDYDDQPSLVRAMEGHDALIITLSVMAPPESEYKLIDAASAAGVPWVMPNTYSSDPEQKEMRFDIGIGPKTAKVLKYIEAKPGISWVGLTCSFWYEHSLCAFKPAFGFDVEKKEATQYDDGNTKIMVSTWPQCGRAVAKLLSLPVLPEIGDNKTLTLDRFRDKYAYISSFLISQKDMLASILRVTGAKEADWKIEYEDSKQRFEDGRKELGAGNRSGFMKALYARVFFPDGCGNYEGKLHNDLLGLPKEDLDEFTRKAIEVAESGYGKDVFK